jgi:MinD superfamily P-loop ATPase
VIGAAGGVGATSVAFHLASAMASSAETCYLEVDPRRGGLERAGLGGKEVRTWVEVGDDEDSLRLSALPLSGGFRALFAPRDRDADPSAVLGSARDRFERVVVDDDPRVGHSLSESTAAVLVMTPTVASAHRGRALLESFPGMRWAVVTNRTGPGGEASRARIQNVLGRKVALWLPRCPALRDAEDAGELVRSRWSPWAARIHSLARALERA